MFGTSQQTYTPLNSNTAYQSHHHQHVNQYPSYASDISYQSPYQNQYSPSAHNTSDQQTLSVQHAPTNAAAPGQCAYQNQYTASSPLSPPYTPNSTTALKPTTGFPGFEKPENNQSESSHKLRQRYHKLHKWNNMVFAGFDIVACLLAVLLEAVMIFMLVKFHQTKDIPAPGRTGPWAKETKLWPTYMMAAAALLTLILAVIGFFLMRKKNTAKARLILRVVRVTIHISCWIAVAILYRVLRTEKDLWGWSCSEKAAGIQQYYKSALDFDQLCTIQTASWGASISEVGIKIILAAIGIYFHIHLEGIKRSIIKDLGEVAWESWDIAI